MAGQLLQQTLDEEKDADQKLTALASQINVNATGAKSVSSQRLGKTPKEGAA